MKILPHHSLNDVVARAFSSAGVPFVKEPAGLCRTDGKRPDGMTLIPWKAGKPVVWDVTTICTTASLSPVHTSDNVAKNGNIVAVFGDIVAGVDVALY